MCRLNKLDLLKCLRHLFGTINFHKSVVIVVSLVYKSRLVFVRKTKLTLYRPDSVDWLRTPNVNVYKLDLFRTQGISSPTVDFRFFAGNSRWNTSDRGHTQYTDVVSVERQPESSASVDRWGGRVGTAAKFPTRVDCYRNELCDIMPNRNNNIIGMWETCDSVVYNVTRTFRIRWP